MAKNGKSKSSERKRKMPEETGNRSGTRRRAARTTQAPAPAAPPANGGQPPAAQPQEGGNMQRSLLWILVILAAVALALAAFAVGLTLGDKDDSDGSSATASSSSSLSSAPGTTGGGASSNNSADNGQSGKNESESTSTGSFPTLPSDKSHGAWKIKTVAGLETSGDRVVAEWLARLKDPAPRLWKTYPNVPNPDVADFNVAAGAEYGVANVPFCQQDTRCDFVVPAWHYRLITADYEFLGHKCGGKGNGCLLLLINVMDKSYTWRNQIADNGFSVPGRYWDGDKLEWAVWGLVSHASANMLNLPTTGLVGQVLNAGTPGNAGANCGNVNGCGSVEVMVVVHAGDRILATAETTVSR